MSGWLDAARRVPVAAVAGELGLAVAPDGKSFGPCPSCGAEHRNNPGRGLDKRGRCRVLPDGAGWGCCSNGSDGCGAEGGGPQLVAWCLTGRQWGKGDNDTSAAVRAWYAARGWCEPWTGGGSALSTPIHPRPVPVAVQVEQRKPRPPAAEVADLWARCVPVTADPEVADWLRGRADGAIDPERVAALDLARALPADLPKLPRWAWYRGRTWAASGHRLIVRAWEADPAQPGRLRVASLHARNILPRCGTGPKEPCANPVPGKCGTHDKAGNPAGAGAVGLVWAPGPDPQAHGMPMVELAEGVPDWLRLVLEVAAELPKGKRPAVWGVKSGSVAPELAALVPEGWTVAIRTHADDGGDKYAEAWLALLAPRGCKLHRQRKDNAPAVSTPVQACPPPDPVAQACEAVRDADGPEALAVVWAFCCRQWGGLDLVPAAVADELRERHSYMDAFDMTAYHAKLREMVTQ